MTINLIVANGLPIDYPTMIKTGPAKGSHLEGSFVRVATRTDSRSARPIMKKHSIQAIRVKSTSGISGTILLTTGMAMTLAFPAGSALSNQPAESQSTSAQSEFPDGITPSHVLAKLDLLDRCVDKLLSARNLTVPGNRTFERQRKLADESSASVDRIQTLIEHIQTATNDTVMDAEQGTKLVQMETELSQETGTAFQEVTQSVEQVVQGMQQISLNVAEREDLAARRLTRVRRARSLSEDKNETH